MSDRSTNADSSRVMKDLLVGLRGFVTSLATAVILWWLELRFGFAFYSWMLWFIVAVGALLSGFAGASGYYAGARIFNHPSSPLLLVNILLASVGAFFAIHYLSYIMLEIGGIRQELCLVWAVPGHRDPVDFHGVSVQSR